MLCLEFIYTRDYRGPKECYAHCPKVLYSDGGEVVKRCCALSSLILEITEAQKMLCLLSNSTLFGWGRGCKKILFFEFTYTRDYRSPKECYIYYPKVLYLDGGEVVKRCCALSLLILEIAEARKSAMPIVQKCLIRTLDMH